MTTIKSARATSCGTARFLLIELSDGTGKAFAVGTGNNRELNAFIAELEKKNTGYTWQWNEDSLAGLIV